MNPFKILLAAPLLFPVADAARPATGCAAEKPFKTRVTFNIDIPDNRYNYKLSARQMTREHKFGMAEWKGKHEDHAWAAADLQVDGLARGGIGITQNANFLGKPYDRYGSYYCPYIKDIEINIHYNTLIFIASELQQGTCRFFAVLDHEHKHHDSSVAVVMEVAKRLKKDMPSIIAELESRYVKRSEVEGGFNNLSQGLRDALQVYSAHMLEKMNEVNDQIDAPEEYERVDAACPPQ